MMGEMMTPIRTPETNIVLGAPNDWGEQRDGKCIGLPVHRDQHANVYYSFWKPTEEDIANILAGMPIRLTVCGAGHPPVAIAVTDKLD